MKKKIIVLSLIATCVIGLTGCTENFEREMKTVSSNLTGIKDGKMLQKHKL